MRHSQAEWILCRLPLDARECTVFGCWDVHQSGTEAASAASSPWTIALRMRNHPLVARSIRTFYSSHSYVYNIQNSFQTKKTLNMGIFLNRFYVDFYYDILRNRRDDGVSVCVLVCVRVCVGFHLLATNPIWSVVASRRPHQSRRSIKARVQSIKKSTRAQKITPNWISLYRVNCLLPTPSPLPHSKVNKNHCKPTVCALLVVAVVNEENVSNYTDAY